jgi:Ca2+-binding RTX toxin-like protein
MIFMAQVPGTDSAETLNGTSGDDVITGLKGNDTLNGLGGGDLFVWSRGDGADVVDGGDGSDTFQANIPYYEDIVDIMGQVTWTDDEKARIEVDATTGHVVFAPYLLSGVYSSHEHTTDYFETGFERTSLQSIEHLQIIGGKVEPPATFTDEDHRIHHFLTNDNFVLPDLAGTGIQDVYFDGGLGDDLFDATIASVKILAYGGVGKDVLIGGSGDDTLFGQEGNDRMTGGGGHNTMVGGSGDDIYFVSAASDSVVELPGEGNDAVFAKSASYTLTANVENLYYSGTQGFTGIGNAGNNWIQGGAGNDYLIGADGNDVLYGGGGANALQGGKGDDIYIVESPTDSFIEFANEGHDTVLTTLTHLTLLGNLEDLRYSGTSAFTGTGNDAANVIEGNVGNDYLVGLGGDDTLIGGAGNDVLSGGSGKDTLVGGLGGNELVGGIGADRFVFKTVHDGADLIHDFSRAEGDKIDVSQLLSSLGALGADPFTNGVLTFQPVAAFGGSGVPATRVLLDIDGSAGPAAPTSLIVVLGGTSVVDHNDFIIT